MKNKLDISRFLKHGLLVKLFLLLSLMSSNLSGQVDIGGALGNAESALTTIDVVDYSALSVNWATNIQISRNFEKFILNYSIYSDGKLYVIVAPTNLELTNASQIENFVKSSAIQEGYRTLVIETNESTNDVETIIISKDNSGSNLYKLIDKLGLEYYLYLAFENSKGILEKEIVNEPISLLQEFHSYELTHFIKPPYAYTIGFPIEYFQEHNTKKFPVIINLHGAGGGKEGAAGMKGFKSPRQKGFSCIVVSPASGGGRWQPDKLNALRNHIVEEYPAADLNRVYFMGFSMGGRGVWDMAMEYGDKIAAAVVNAGGFRGKTDLSDMDFSKVVDLPLWAFHNCDDNVADITIGWGPINALVEAGGKPKYLINIAPNPDFQNQDKNNKYPTVFAADYRNLKGSRKGHKLNGNYFYTEEFYKWLFSQTR